MSDKKRIVVGISGATGTILGVRLLEVLQNNPQVETHLIMSEWAIRTLIMETSYTPDQVIAMADRHYEFNNLAAPISSGSFIHDGMVIIPCSMNTLAGIASGYHPNLLLRAADVTLKERRPLVLVTRESPLHEIHLENMLKVTRAGAVIFPPVIAQYHRPNTLSEVIDQIVTRVLDQLGIHLDLFRRWGTPSRESSP